MHREKRYHTFWYSYYDARRDRATCVTEYVPIDPRTGECVKIRIKKKRRARMPVKGRYD